MAIIVQLLSRNNKVIQQQRFTQDELNIGRGYQNDLRIDDPYVCANHLQINRDSQSGVLICQDLESINGTKINGNRSTTATLHQGDIISIGRSRLRLLSDDEQVADTLLLSDFEESIGWLNNKYVFALLGIALLVFILSSNALNTFEELKHSKLLFAALGQILLISIWPLFFAGLAKMNKKEGRLVSQINLIWMYLILMECYTFIRRIIEFNAPDSLVYEGVDFVFYSTSLFTFIWLTLFIAFHQQSTKRLTISTAMSLIILLGFYYDDLTKADNFSPRPSYALPVLPVQYQLVNPVNTESLIIDSNQLFEDVKDLKDKEDR